MRRSILAVLGGDVNISQLKEIYTKSGEPVVIAADKGLEALDNAEIRPDIVMGDYDSVDKVVLDRYRDENTIFFDRVKDFTDGEAAITHAVNIIDHSEAENAVYVSHDNTFNKDGSGEKDGHITILGATGNRPDHMMANISLLKIACDAGVLAEILDINSRIRLFRGPYEIPFTKAEENYDYISLIPLGDKAEGITIKGFKYNADDLNLYQGSSRGISNELVEEKGLISLQAGYLLVIETGDGEI